jgi:hypothetical protein
MTEIQEQIFVHRDGERIELIGAELETFLEQRAKDRIEIAAQQAEQENNAAQKAAILERIGLTEEELQIVLGA